MMVRPTKRSGWCSSLIIENIALFLATVAAVMWLIVLVADAPPKDVCERPIKDLTVQQIIKCKKEVG